MIKLMSYLLLRCHSINVIPHLKDVNYIHVMYNKLKTLLCLDIEEKILSNRDKNYKTVEYENLDLGIHINNT